MGLRDIVLWIKLALNPSAAAKVKQQIQETLAQGTNPAAANANINSMGSQVGILDKAVRKLGVTLLTVFGGRQIYRFLEESIMMFGRFEQKLQQSIAILGGVDDAMRKRLGDTATELSKELNLSADDLAGAYLHLASAGLTAEQSIRALPAVALFAKAGMLSLADAVMYLAEANSVLGYKSVDPAKNLAGMVRIMDVMSKVGAESLGTIQSLIEALTNRAGDSLRLFGKDVEEGAAALAVFADRGVQGRLAGERLDMFLRQASLAAVKHKETFARYGIAIFDSAGKMRNMADIADDLTKALGGLKDEQQVIAMSQLGFQARTVSSVKAFIGQGDAIRKYEAAARSASGFTKQVAETQMKSSVEQWGKVKETLNAARREIGEALLPALGGLKDLIGDETNPRSLVGMMKEFAKWLKEHPTLIANLGKTILWLVTQPLRFFGEIVSTLYDGVVALGGTGVFILIRAFQLLMLVVWSALKPLGVFINWISGGFFHEINDMADAMHRLNDEIDAFGTAAGKAALKGGKSFWDKLTHPSGLGFGSGTGVQGPRLIDTYTDGLPVGGRSTTEGTGNALVETEKRNKKITELSDRLNKMLAQHTATRVDDEMLKLHELEAEYKKIYGKNIPNDVLEAFKKIRSQIGQENAAKAVADQFKDLFTFHQKSDFTAENLQKVQDFAERVKELRDQTEKGSDAWAAYNAVLNKALELRDEIVEHLTDEGERAEEARLKEVEARLHRIRQIGERTADALSNAFEKFTEVLLVGTRRGADAFEQLGRGMLAAMLSPLAQYTMFKAKENFARSAQEIAEGIAALSNPFLAGTASGHFLAAAKFAAVGAMWGALGGVTTGAQSAIGNSSHGNASDHGRDQVDRSTQQGTDIHIYIDGVDPNNPRHQKLVGDTIQQYAERTGGNLTIKTGK
jgi:TP901 family phage tail tape measure protein